MKLCEKVVSMVADAIAKGSQGVIEPFRPKFILAGRKVYDLILEYRITETGGQLAQGAPLTVKGLNVEFSGDLQPHVAKIVLANYSSIPVAVNELIPPTEQQNLEQTAHVAPRPGERDGDVLTFRIPEGGLEAALTKVLRVKILEVDKRTEQVTLEDVAGILAREATGFLVGLSKE